MSSPHTMNPEFNSHFGSHLQIEPAAESMSEISDAEDSEGEEEVPVSTPKVSVTYPLDEYHTPKKLMIHTGSMVKTTSASQLARTVKKPHRSRKLSLLVEEDQEPEARVLVLYTGGTIGMKCQDGVYVPEAHFLPTAIRLLPPLNDRRYVEKFYSNESIKPFCLPPIRSLRKRIIYWLVEYQPLLDSSDMTFDDWIRIGTDIKKAYEFYDGFVVLHGTDTLAYTASALSFMFENLGKPVIITGAQIPVCETRSDGRDNLIGALIFAGNYDIPEVTVYFNNKLLRGNRSLKLDNSGLEAFDSPNMLPLAHMEITIKIMYESIYRSPSTRPFEVHDNLCRHIGLLRIFPSISIDSVRAFLQPPTQGCILQTFGAGNMPSKRTDIIAEIRQAVERGCIIVNCSQCLKGQVDVHYLTGKILYDVGVIPGSDMTVEAALTKLSYVLGKDEWDLPTKRKMMQRNLRGEMTVARFETLQQLEIIPQLTQFLRITSSSEVQLLRNALFPPLLCHAAQTGNLDLLESLAQSGASLSVPDYNGRTALHVAASCGQSNIVSYLLKSGANANAKDQWNENPLMNAVRSKNLNCIRTLKEAGAVIGCNPIELGMDLCSTAYHGDLDALAAWITAGADINQPDFDGRTALHVAVAQKNATAVQYLINNGADPHIRDKFGRSPLNGAETSGVTEIIQILRDGLKTEEGEDNKSPHSSPPVKFEF